MTPQARALPAWVRHTIDYGGLAAWALTIVITKNAVASSWVIVGASLLALAVGLLVEKRLAPMPLVTAVFGIFFGGLTLFFHDERFIKVKPTILYTAFGLFLVTGALRGKNPLKILMGDAFHLPDAVIRTLTIRYALFFFALAIANEVIWRTQSTVFWGLFKVPGVPIIIFLFAMTQAPLMMKHMPDDEEKPPADSP
jgi:intracellular septation protein